MASQEKQDDRSKITIPQVFHKILPRGNISKIIENASLHEAICIVAPYGCGKTLAGISWLQECDQQAVWLSLNEADNSEDSWNFLSEVISQGLQDSREKILVLDNFHFIKDVTLLRSIKDFIFLHLGEWRVIIISRTELHPVFNDLMLKGRICLITLKELSFSTEEIADYFILNGCDVPHEDIMQMHEDTEGWPAALNVILTVSRGGPMGYREAARAYVKGFFETEIWEELSGNIKDFLLKTSVLDRLTPSACHAVTGKGATLPTLNWLFLNGLFIARLDKRDTYYYHRVFRDFLLDKLRTESINERELYMKVAWWLYERNELEKSFPYFFKAGDLYGINQVLKILNPANMGIESFLEMTSCLMTLDIMELKPYPVILARMALIQYMKGNVAEMQELYHIFLEWIDPGILPISWEEYAEYIWEAGWLCYLDPDEEMRNNAKHEEWTNYREYVPHLQDLQRARGAVLRFPSILRGIRDYCSTLISIEAFMRHAEETGDSTVREEVSVWETYLIIAEYAYETEEFKKAEEIIRRIMALVEEQQLTDLYFVCTALLVKLLRAINTPREIDALTERLGMMIMDREDYFLLPNFHAFQLRNRLASGQPGQTEIFEDENKRYEEKPYFYLFYRHMTLVRGLLSTGDYNEAMLILGNLELLCQKYKRTMDLMEVNILRSIALYGLGYEDGACRRLKEALAEAKKYGFIRIFSDDAKDIWPILELVKKQISDKYIRNIVISCKKTLMQGGHKLLNKKYKHIELTKTELKILKSLQAGMSYMEIAQDNDIQLSTVKSHAHSIYSKLEVDNKTSAVIEAQNKGILTP